MSTLGSYNETYGDDRRRHGADALVLPVGDRAAVGAELNAEIEHASPYGKDVGEKVPGEKKKIGALAERHYAEKQAKGEIPVPLIPDEVNCDLEHGPPSDAPPLRTSDLLIGAAVLLPAALKIGRDVRKRFT